ncbi:MAG: type VI secretion system-associated FHA domain protein [Thermodesulfobacteriota bacterium]|nr:type VI secretion system-associated FHA domain protein [Thermodesulfobacteriota bacterium]
MISRTAFEQFVNEVRHIYREDHAQAEVLIRSHLERQFGALPIDERLSLVENLVDEFDKTNRSIANNETLEMKVYTRLFSLLLGKNISEGDLASTELLERLTESLNTIFDILNQLVSLINTTLLGKHIEEETIRHVIGSHLEREDSSMTLERYLDQIKRAFLITQKAFIHAMNTKMNEILSELEPDRIAEKGSKGLKFGSLKKAELFDLYQEKFHTCKKWFESGRFMEEFLREFERNCRKLYQE